MIVNVTHTRSVKALGEVANKAAEQGEWELVGLLSHAQHLIVTLDDKVHQQEGEITELKTSVGELQRRIDRLTKEHTS